MPDLNSVPASPHVLAASRRASQQALGTASTSQPPSQQQMPPPPTPSSPSLNILPSNQNAVNISQLAGGGALPSPPLLPPAATGRANPLAESAGVGPGPGPIRHPQPLTAADLHLQMEKEQEARVNRLSRELSHLRAQHNASVASNTSSTSASASGAEPVDPHLLSGAGFTIPSTRRHHRSSSNTSTRSQVAATLGTSLESSRGGANSARPGPPHISLSRQNSTTSHRSRTSSPPPPQHLTPGTAPGADSTYSYFQHQQLQRLAAPTSAPTATSSMAATPGSGGPASEQLSPGLMSVTSRYEETAFHRGELEAAKRENEGLKRRIRELERMVREQRGGASGGGSGGVAASGGSNAARTRSESVSTTTSTQASLAGGAATPTGGAGIAAPRDADPARRPGERERSMTTQSLGVGVPEEELRVGESAASAGLRAPGAQRA